MTAQHYTCSVFYRGKNENGYKANLNHNKFHWYENCLNFRLFYFKKLKWKKK